MLQEGPGYENFIQEIRFNGSNVIDENENLYYDNDHFSEQLMDLEAQLIEVVL